MVEAGAREYEKNGHDKNQAASTTLSGGAGIDATWGGKGGSKGEGGGDDGILATAKRAAMNYVVGGLVSALLPDDVSGKVNAALEFKGSADSTSNQGIGEEGHHSEAVNVKRNLEVLSNASKGETWGKENSSDQTKATEVRAAYEEQTRAEESVTKSAQKVQEYQNLVQHSSSVTGTSDRNMRHQLIKQLTSQGWGQDTAAQMVGNGHPEAQRAFDKVVARQVAQVANQINQGKGELSDENLQQNLNKTGEENKNKITTNPNNLINPQDNPTTGNFDNTAKTIEVQKARLGNEFDSREEHATNKVLSTESKINKMADPLKAEIKQQDDKSFRKSWLGGDVMGVGRQEAPKITSESLTTLDGRTSHNPQANLGSSNAVMSSSYNSSERPIPISNKDSSMNTPEMLEVKNLSTDVDSGNSERPMLINNRYSSVNIEESKRGTNLSTDAVLAQTTKNPAVEQQSKTNSVSNGRNISSGSKEPNVIPNTAVQPKNDSANPTNQQGTSNNSSIKPGADLNIGSGDLDSQGNKKPTTLNLSNLQKAERKNK